VGTIPLIGQSSELSLLGEGGNQKKLTLEGKGKKTVIIDHWLGGRGGTQTNLSATGEKGRVKRHLGNEEGKESFARGNGKTQHVPHWFQGLPHWVETKNGKKKK